MNLNLSYVVDTESSGKTVKYILKRKLELSEKLIKQLKYNDKVLCNGVPTRVRDTIHAGDTIEAVIDFVEEPNDLVPEQLDIDILFEDESLIAINKRPGIVVHPTWNHPTGTVANAVMYHLLSKGISKKVRPVSRLDRDTTGIILFAKNQHIQNCLIHQMKDRTFVKEYIGIVDGILDEPIGTINLPIARFPGSIIQRHTCETGTPSVTHYEVLETLNQASMVKFILETGRTHQIRVHCQAVGHPLIGDTLYSHIPTDQIPRQALHSHKVSFIHPFTKQRMDLSAPIPEDMEQLLAVLRK